MSDHDNLAERIEDVYINKLCQLPVGTPWEKARSEVATIIAPILARNAAMEAVLRKARTVLKKTNGHMGHAYGCTALQHMADGWECDCGKNKLNKEVQDLISRIDKLTAKAGQ